MGQYQSPRGTRFKGGDRHLRWYTRGQVSQHNSLPPKPQLSQWWLLEPWQNGQLQAPSGITERGGLRQLRWYTRGHVSQQSSSPSSLQTSQTLSFSSPVSVPVTASVSVAFEAASLVNGDTLVDAAFFFFFLPTFLLTVTGSVSEVWSSSNFSSRARSFSCSSLTFAFYKSSV